MTTNGVQLFSRLISYPLINDTYTQANTYYLWAKNKNAYVASTLNMAETGLTRVASIAAQPIVRRLNNNTLTSLDNLVCSQLDRLETFCPAVRKPTTEIVEDCKGYYVERVKPIVDRAAIPVKGAVQIGSDLVYSFPIVNTLQENIKTLSDEWQKALEAKKSQLKSPEVETPSHYTEGLLEAARQWTGHLRLALEAFGEVVYGRLAEDNRQCLSNAKSYVDQLSTALAKARQVSDLSEAFFVQSKEALQLVQSSVEQCLKYIAKFNPATYFRPRKTETTVKMHRKLSFVISSGRQFKSQFELLDESSDGSNPSSPM